MKRGLSACLVIALTSTIVSSACVAAPAGQATALVKYDDLDLSTPQGVKVLDRRIVIAADRVCLDASGPAPGQQIDLGCRDDAIAAARAQIPQAIAEQRIGRSPALAESNPR